MNSSQSENTTRIAKNVILLYGRMLLSMVISLYASRVVLSTLGVEDYGIYGVVGGFVAMLSTVFSSLSTAVGRFLTFELGKGDQDSLNRTFSTSLIIHAIMAISLLLIIEAIGLWFLNTKMNIPAERMYAANWVFQCSVFGLILAIINVPYAAAIISHERMTAYAYIGLFDIVLRLLIVLLLAYASLGVDKLIVYAVLCFGSGLLVVTIYITYGRKHFVECRYGFSLDKKILRDMLGFSGWNFVGTSATALKDQGVNILLNLFCGPVVNAARGLAFSVNAAVSSFVGNFMTALNPQITKSYASGERDYTIFLVQRGARFSFYILLILVLPLFFEADFVLTLWLKNYPEHTTNFVRLVLLLSLCDSLSHTLVTLQLATGKIRNYQIVVGGMSLMNFPVSYVLLKMRYAPETTMVTAIIISLCCLLLRLIMLRKTAQLSVRNYLMSVLGNVLLVSACAVILPSIVYYNFATDGVVRFIFIGATCVISTSAIIFGIGCSRGERAFIWQKCVVTYNTLRSKMKSNGK